MTSSFTESIIEQASLDWLKDLGYTSLFGGDIAPGEPTSERMNYWVVGACLAWAQRRLA